MIASEPLPIRNSIRTTQGTRQLGLPMAEIETAAVKRLAAFAIVDSLSADDKQQLQTDLQLLCVSAWPALRQHARSALGNRLVSRRGNESAIAAVQRHAKAARDYLAGLEKFVAGKRSAADTKRVAELAKAAGFNGADHQVHVAEMTRRHSLQTADIAALDAAKRVAERALEEFERDTEARRRARLQLAIHEAANALQEANGARGYIANIERGVLNSVFEFSRHDYQSILEPRADMPQPTRQHGDKPPACEKCGETTAMILAGTQGTEREGAAFGVVRVPPRRVTRRRYLCRTCNLYTVVERPDLQPEDRPGNRHSTVQFAGEKDAVRV